MCMCVHLCRRWALRSGWEQLWQIWSWRSFCTHKRAVQNAWRLGITCTQGPSMTVAAVNTSQTSLPWVPKSSLASGWALQDARKVLSDFSGHGAQVWHIRMLSAWKFRHQTVAKVPNHLPRPSVCRGLEQHYINVKLSERRFLRLMTQMVHSLKDRMHQHDNFMKVWESRCC